MKKTAANGKVKRAVEKGILIRPDTCERCGRRWKTIAHHSDYDKPFDVMWLCSSCHMKIHRAIWRELADAGFSVPMPPLEKIERNQSVVNTHLTHPDWTQKQIAIIYNISASMVGCIIRREEDRHRFLNNEVFLEEKRD